jgi:hypothetical protein
MNAVRKHLSRIKGGRLALAAYPATIIALILSDVIGDDLDVIGSGPTVADSSTLESAAAILDKYRIPEPSAWTEETPKAGDAAFERVQNIIVGSNRQAIDAAAKQAKSLGYRTLVLSTFIDGETREIAAMHAAIAKEVLASGRPVKRPACLLSGGETTVTLRGNGLGGRNQEFVLAAAIALDGAASVTIFSAGTDGTDGPTDAAGAIADSRTIANARARGLDPARFLGRQRLVSFLRALGIAHQDRSDGDQRDGCASPADPVDHKQRDRCDDARPSHPAFSKHDSRVEEHEREKKMDQRADPRRAWASPPHHVGNPDDRERIVDVQAPTDATLACGRSIRFSVTPVMVKLKREPDVHQENRAAHGPGYSSGLHPSQQQQRDGGRIQRRRPIG